MYRWTITKDHLAAQFGDKPSTNVKGPRDYNETITDNAARWSAYDDDGECYFEGMIYGDYDGFEPLDDFCQPDSGCTAIKINGEWL